MPAWPKSFYTFGAGLLTARAEWRLRQKRGAVAAQQRAFDTLMPRLAEASFWRDTGIEARDASAVLPSSTIAISLRPNTYLRPFLLDFIQSVAPRLTPFAVRKAVRDFQGKAQERIAGVLSDQPAAMDDDDDL